MLFGGLLALAGTGWVLTSASLITGFAAAPVKSPADFLRVVVLNEQSLLFEAWLLLGSVLAAPMFASSVVAIPLLLDRPHGVMQAVRTSVSAALASPAAMALWATLILVAHAHRHGQLHAGPGGGGALAGARQLARLPRPRAARRERHLMFGYSEEQIAQFGLTFGVGAFMLYMVFIIWQLARESKARPLRHLRALPGAGFRAGRLRCQERHQAVH